MNIPGSEAMYNADANDPTNWNTGADFIEFKNPEEAKRAEAIMNRLLRESFQNGRNVGLEAAATKLDHYAAGLAALGGRGATAVAAAKMVRDLKEILSRDAASQGSAKEEQ